MTRRLFTLAALLALVVCLATVVLWVRTRHHTARLVLYGDLHLESAVRDVVVLQSEEGFCTIHWIARQPPTPPPRGDMEFQ